MQDIHVRQRVAVVVKARNEPTVLFVQSNQELNKEGSASTLCYRTGAPQNSCATLTIYVPSCCWLCSGDVRREGVSLSTAELEVVIGGILSVQLHMKEFAVR